MLSLKKKTIQRTSQRQAEKNKATSADRLIQRRLVLELIPIFYYNISIRVFESFCCIRTRARACRYTQERFRQAAARVLLFFTLVSMYIISRSYFLFIRNIYDDAPSSYLSFFALFYAHPHVKNGTTPTAPLYIPKAYPCPPDPTVNHTQVTSAMLKWRLSE